MLVVADASPLNILIRIGYVTILPELFTTVLIPMQVAAELTATNTPEPVKHFMHHRPSWLDVRPVATPLGIPGLDGGELAAIALATSTRAELLLMDEAAGRAHAKSLGLQVIGAIGVLELASRLNLVELTGAIQRLQQTDFRLSQELIDEIMERHNTADATGGSRFRRDTA